MKVDRALVPDCRAISVDVRRFFSAFAILAMSAVLNGCASRPEVGFLAPTAAVADGTSEHALLVATTRKRDDRPGALFNGERSSALDYAAVTVSIPPRHIAGEIEWPSFPPGNPETDVVVRQAKYLNRDEEFVQALNAQLALRPRGSRKVIIFIHGYNTVFAEALYRLAQIEHDAEFTDVPVLFA